MKLTDHLTVEERPREKLIARGPQALTSAELLAIVLRGGTVGHNVLDLARALLALAGGSLLGLSRSSLPALSAPPGMGPVKAATLCAVFEIVRRCLQESAASPGVPLTTARQVYDLMWPRLMALDHEECWGIFLSRSQRVLAMERLSSGGLSSTVFDVGQVARKALEWRAASLVIAHNHPSGNPVPGKADISVTADLKRALRAFNIELLDHVVISDGTYFSFSDGIQEQVRPFRPVT